ncbi:hypothetical protein M885DRAFT_529917 [Pelagophyceae sp. CCMP2097]|nr:hypothetical protein M885DRAFT_529917 [Pelagophyceae sp. CCMP2097]
MAPRLLGIVLAWSFVVRAKNIWTAAALAENMDGGVVVQVGLGLCLRTVESLGSGFADPRLIGVLADPRGKGDVFRNAARAVDSLSGHHGRLLCWLRPSSGADEHWHPDVTVVGGDFGIKNGFRKGGFWFYVGGAPADLVYSSPDFPTDGSVDIEAPLNVARSSLRLSSRVKKLRSSHGSARRRCGEQGLRRSGSAPVVLFTHTHTRTSFL